MDVKNEKNNGLLAGVSLPPSSRAFRTSLAPKTPFPFPFKRLPRRLLPLTLFEPCGAVFIMNSKIHLSKNSLNEYFQAISHYYRVYSLSGFLKGRSMNVLVFFYPALAEVQVVVLSVFNLIRQGFPATCRIGHCCVCSTPLSKSAYLEGSSVVLKGRHRGKRTNEGKKIHQKLKGQCPDYAHARASSVFSSKDNRTVKLTRQDFLPERTADRDLLFIFSSNILDFRRSLSSYIKIWLAVRRLIATLSLAGPPRDPKISFRSL